MDTLTLQANIFKALGHPVRLKIMKKLIAKELCVCDLVEDTEFTQANLSQHLKILINAGLIAKRKKGNYSFYRILDLKSIEFLELCGIISKGYIETLI